MKLSKWGMSIGLAVAVVALAACGSDDNSVSNSGNEDLFTSSGFQKALDAVKEKAGDDAQMLEVQITEGGADFTLREGEQATGFRYTGGVLHDVQVDLVGPGSLEGQDFPISEVDPAAINKIVSGVQSESDANDTQVTVMRLTKQNVEGTLQWSIVAEGGGRTGLPYTADPDGSNVTSAVAAIGGAGTATGATDTTATTGDGSGTSTGGVTVTAPNGKTPQEIAQCVQNAGTNVSKLQACTQ